MIKTRLITLPFLLALLVLLPSQTPLWAQGSISGTVTNSGGSTPADGEIQFFGFLDDTDEEIRLSGSDGAGYESGHWFDEFQNYLTEGPGNPYDYYFFNSAIGEGFHLEDTIPNNSFEIRNFILSPLSWPSAPGNIAGGAISSGELVLTWTGGAGSTYHVYRRQAVSNGSFFRLDDPSGALSNPGVSDNFFVDTTIDGLSGYDYLVIAEDSAGGFSPPSAILTINSAIIVAPSVAGISPTNGPETGGTPVTISGQFFDMAGVVVNIGGELLTDINISSPLQITGVTPAHSPGLVDVVVTNSLSGLSSISLVDAFEYNSLFNPPLLDSIGPQSVDKGNLLTFLVTASDFDNDSLIMSSSTLPTGATYDDHFNGTATFNWPTTSGDVGFHLVSFFVFDGLLSDTEQVLITVVDPDPCCVGRTGDIDVSGIEPNEVDLSDLGLLADFLFADINPIALPCVGEADVDALGGSNPVDLSDLGLLVEYLFSPPGSVELPNCF